MSLGISYYRLSAVFLLVDGNYGLQPVDHTAIEMLEEYGKPYAVGVFTGRAVHHGVLLLIQFVFCDFKNV